MNTQHHILIALLPHIFGGTSRRLWERRAAKGQLGPVHSEPGKCRNRTVERVEIEHLFGAITDDQYAEGIRQYESARRLVRRAS